MPERGSGRPRTKPADERRDDLLKAAEGLFLAKGVAGTTIDDLARAAGISKGAFYLHFAGKGDVFDGLRARFVETVLRSTADAMAGLSPGDWPGRLSAWGRACATAYAEGAALHGLVYAAAPPPDRAGLTRNPIIDQLRELLEQGIKAGAWSLEDPAFAAIFLFNALHGAVSMADAGTADLPLLLDQIDAHMHRLVGGAS